MSCRCISVPNYGDVHFCSEHQRPIPGAGSPLGKRHSGSHTKKTGSPTHKRLVRERQLAREGFTSDHKKKQS